MKSTENVYPMIENFTFELSKNWINYNQIKSHFHLCYELYFLLEGEVEYFIGDELFRVIPGSIVIITPGTIHKTNRIGHINRKRMLAYISEDDFRDYPPGISDLPASLKSSVLRLNEKNFKRIESLFIQLAEESSAAEPDRLTIKSVLVLILAMLRKHMANNVNDAPPQKEPAPANPMLEIARYISKHYYDDISLETLSDIFHMNPSHISRAFKKKIGFTYSTYLKNIRIRNACELLLETDMSATEVARKTGFNSCSDFCRAFKDIMHISPLEYRRNVNER